MHSFCLKGVFREIIRKTLHLQLTFLKLKSYPDYEPQVCMIVLMTVSTLDHAEAS